MTHPFTSFWVLPPIILVSGSLAVHASPILDTIIPINSNSVPLDVFFLGTIICTKGSSVWISPRVRSIFPVMSSLMNLCSLLPPYIPRLAPAITLKFSSHRPQFLGMIVFLILIMFILDLFCLLLIFVPRSNRSYQI
jgi:hypothetical protein